MSRGAILACRGLEESSIADISLGTFSAWFAYWEAEDAEAALVEWIRTLPLVDQDKTYRALHRHFEDAAYQEAVEFGWVYGPDFGRDQVVGVEKVVERSRRPTGQPLLPARSGASDVLP